MEYIDKMYGKVYRFLEESLLTVIREELSNEVIEDACRKAGYSFRKRLLTPVTTCLYWIAAALNREESFAAVWQMLWSPVAGNFGTLASRGYDSSLSCHARQRFPHKVLEYIFAYLRDKALAAGQPYERGFGRRVILADGTTAKTERTPALEAYYGVPAGRGKKSYFPVMRWVSFIVAGTGVVLGYKSGAYATSEIALARDLFEKLAAGDLFVADEYYASKYNQALLLRHGADYIMRLHHRFKLTGHPVTKQGEDDYLVEVRFSSRQRRDDPALPQSMRVRVICHRIKVRDKEKQMLVVTSLLDKDAYPAEEVVRYYRMRWRCETDINAIKTKLHTKRFRSKTIAGVEKELCAHLIGYNIIRLLMLRAAIRRKVDPLRINFIAAVRKILKFSDRMLSAAPHRLFSLFENFLINVAADLNPKRPGRHEPRCKRDVYDKYPVFRTSRELWRKTGVLNL